MSKSITKNLIYNIILTIFNIAFPLITSPYISRILKIKSIGEINLAMSYVSWFVVLTGMGLTNYGMREVAKNRENRENLSKVVSGIIQIHGIVVILGMVVYCSCIFLFPIFKTSTELSLIFSINLLLSVFTLDWFYTGLEEYKYITYRSLLVKIFSLICMFLFVKTEADYVSYAKILVFALSANNLFNIYNIKKYVNFKIIKKEIFKPIIGARFFYYQALIGSIYQLFDQLLLGGMSGVSQVAYFTRSKQIIMIIMGIILALTKTLTPRLSSLYSKDKEEYNKMLQISFDFICAFVFPVIIGTWILRKAIMFFLGGENFLPAASSFGIMTLLLMFTSFSIFIDTQISIPRKIEKNTLFSVINVAIASLIFNLILIPKFGAVGSASALVIAEGIGLLTHIFLARKNKVKFDFLTINFLKYILATIIMGICLKIIEQSIDNYYLKLLVVTTSGLIIYVVAIYIISEIFTKEKNEIRIIFYKIKGN